jgi:hypothetical protein
MTSKRRGTSWAVPSSSFLSGRKVLKDELVAASELMDLLESDASVLTLPGKWQFKKKPSGWAILIKGKKRGQLTQLNVEV